MLYSMYNPDAYYMGQFLEVVISSTDEIIQMSITGPIDVD
jgi:hypothetical protein